MHALRPRSSSASAFAPIAGRESAGRNWAENRRAGFGSCPCEEALGPRPRLLDHLIPDPLGPTQWRKFHLVHGLHHVKQILTDARGDDRKLAIRKQIERRKITPTLRFLWFAAFTAGWAGSSGPARSVRWRRPI